MPALVMDRNFTAYTAPFTGRQTSQRNCTSNSTTPFLSTPEEYTMSRIEFGFTNPSWMQRPSRSYFRSDTKLFSMYATSHWSTINSMRRVNRHSW